MTTLPDLLVASEVAAILRVAESTLYRWRLETRATGSQVGPPSFRNQGRVVWDSAELEDWIARQRQTNRAS